MLTPPRTRKRQRTPLVELTPIAAWILKQRLQTIDPRTGEPYSERQVSTQAGLDYGAVNRYMHGAQPTSDACLKLALFFTVYPDHIINPDYVRHLAGHRPDPYAPEYLPPERTSTESTDDLIRRKDPQLYDLLAQAVELPEAQRRELYEALKTLLRFIMGKA
jgi:transcriptional regulator with XRE-family HTH domain